jgi:hypothetical protein
MVLFKKFWWVMVILAIVLIAIASFFLLPPKNQLPVKEKLVFGVGQYAIDFEDPTCKAYFKGPAYCNHLPQEDITDCLNEYYILIAIRDADPNQCDNLPDSLSQSVCKAIIESDEDACLSHGLDLSPFCLSIIRSDISLCQTLEADKRDDCEAINLKYAAFMTKDKSHCETINFILDKARCLSLIFGEEFCTLEIRTDNAEPELSELIQLIESTDV